MNRPPLRSEPLRAAGPRRALPRVSVVLVAAIVSVLLLAQGPVSAEPYLDGLRSERSQLTDRIRERKAQLRSLERRHLRVVAAGRRQLARLERQARPRDYPRRFRVLQRAIERKFQAGRDESRSRVKRRRKALVELIRRRDELARTIDALTPLKACPVRGSIRIANDFGAPRYLDGEFHHWHRGNDIIAPYGAPILAPFDGLAVAGSDTLGGMFVNVYGDRGYVYNAHLSRFGTLGRVRRGTVVGYVGITGNATGPHNHFQWHPGGGSPVDPYVYLLRACT